MSTDVTNSFRAAELAQPYHHKQVSSLYATNRDHCEGQYGFSFSHEEHNGSLHELLQWERGEWFHLSRTSPALQLVPHATVSIKLDGPTSLSSPQSLNSEVVSRIFRKIFRRYGKCSDDVDAVATVAVPVNLMGHNEFHVTFRYFATQPQPNLAREIRKRYYITTVRKPQSGPLKLLAEGGYIPPSPLNELCLRKIVSWIRDCTSTHSSTDCRSAGLGASGFVSIRLIEVGTGAGLPRIVESDGLAARYTALSYCWGNAQIKVTKKANLQDRKRFLTWACLPTVFRDAIVLTRALGIKYIWIDAICIVQDDNADMSVQLSQMGQVYREAYLVISADSARDADERLFKERSPQMYLRTKSLHPQAGGSEVLVNQGINHDSLGGRTMDAHNWPLARRGWTLQERFLATRIIHFSFAEIVWECNERLQCECKFLDQRSEDMDDLLWTSLRSRYIQTFDKHTSDDDRAKCWCLITSEYSGRLFSNDIDRLSAISGLARQFATPGMGEYRAGLWTAYVLKMISWHRNTPASGRRPSGYIAPSWSWASLIGEIDWEFSKDWDFSETAYVAQNRFVAQVLRIECYPSGADLFGSVCGGYLTISSPTLTVAVKPSEDGGRKLDLPSSHTWIPDIDSPTKMTELDDVNSVKCLFLENLGWLDAPALVLKSGSSDFGVFRRIGRLFVHGSAREELPAFTTEVLTIY